MSLYTPGCISLREYCFFDCFNRIDVFFLGSIYHKTIHSALQNPTTLKKIYLCFLWLRVNDSGSTISPRPCSLGSFCLKKIHLGQTLQRELCLDGCENRYKIAWEVNFLIKSLLNLKALMLKKPITMHYFNMQKFFSYYLRQ